MSDVENVYTENACFCLFSFVKPRGSNKIAKHNTQNCIEIGEREHGEFWVREGDGTNVFFS